jgi:hypothetical protein
MFPLKLTDIMLFSNPTKESVQRACDRTNQLLILMLNLGSLVL